jgi:hypothetical protein
MSQRPSASTGPGSAGQPAGPGSSGQVDDDPWPDDLWPDDASPARPGEAAGEGAPSGPWPPQPGPPARPGGGPRRRWRPPFALVVIALVAAAAGAVVALAVHDISSPGPALAGSPSAQPSGLAPVPSGGTNPGGSGTSPGGGGPGGALTAFVVGRVSAVSGTSITIGGPAHSVTAAVTAATRVTGKVTGIHGIKVGDQVSAQLTQNGGKFSVVAVQDPAQAPAAGSVP